MRKDEYGRPLYQFLLDYEHDGANYSIDLWAYDLADAEAKAASIAKGVTIAGQVFHVVAP